MTRAVSCGIMFKMYEKKEWQQTRAEVDTLITSDLFSTSPAGSRCHGCQQGQKTLIKLCPEPRLVVVRTPGSCSSLPRPRCSDCFNLDTAPQFRDGDDTRRCCLLPWQMMSEENNLSWFAAPAELCWPRVPESLRAVSLVRDNDTEKTEDWRDPDLSETNCAGSCVVQWGGGGASRDPWYRSSDSQMLVLHSPTHPPPVLATNLCEVFILTEKASTRAFF